MQKKYPPEWIIKIVTKTDLPVPLPAGNNTPFTLPDGFRATIYSRETPGARVMTKDSRGTILVSLMGTGKVVALPDENHDAIADKTVVLLENLNNPHGILLQCPHEETTPCTLYVAESDGVSTYSYDTGSFKTTLVKNLIALPGEGLHITRSLVFASDGRLLVAEGSTCNVCIEENEKRASITAINLETGTTSLFARGLRNTVGLTIDPVTGAVWGADNGRDLLGDDIPPDEVNIITEGKNYEWPYCYGKNIHDTDFDKNTYMRNPCMEPFETPAHIDLQAHSAPLGLAFIPEEGWPSNMKNNLLVTFHGSWNRSVSTEYKIVLFNLDANRNIIGVPLDFMTGFLGAGLTPDDAIGRPVGLLAQPGGILFVSDDRAGAIYRISPSAK